MPAFSRPTTPSSQNDEPRRMSGRRRPDHRFSGPTQKAGKESEPSPGLPDISLFTRPYVLMQLAKLVLCSTLQRDCFPNTKTATWDAKTLPHSFNAEP